MARTGLSGLEASESIPLVSPIGPGGLWRKLGVAPPHASIPYCKMTF